MTLAKFVTPRWMWQSWINFYIKCFAHVITFITYKLAPIIWKNKFLGMPNKLTQCFKNVFTATVFDRIITALLSRVNSSVICIYQILSWISCKSIEIVSLKVLAFAKPTTGGGDDFLYLIQILHFDITLSIIFDNSEFKAPAFCIIFL